jgi:hypothetical protein
LQYGGHDVGDLPVEVKEIGKERFTHVCCILIDGVFLCLWAAVNFGVTFFFNRFPPDGHDKLIASVLQMLIGVATLIPLTIDIYSDIRVMWIRANDRIKRASASGTTEHHLNAASQSDDAAPKMLKDAAKGESS